MIQEKIRRMLERYGDPVSIKNGSCAKTAKAFIQPLRHRAYPYINEKLIPAGLFDKSCKLYIGEKSNRLKAGESTVCCNGTEYTVVADEEYLVGGEPLYVWAILRPSHSLEEDDYDVFDR